METLYLALALALMGTGVIGTVVPILPGPTLILAGVVGHQFLAPEHWRLPVAFLVMIGGLYLLSIIVDHLAGALGGKKFGASRLGIIGGLLGAFAGIFFGIPGIFLGPLAGALIGELLARQKLGKAVKAGFGTFLGTVLGLAARLTLAVGMVVTFLMGWIVF